MRADLVGVVLLDVLVLLACALACVARAAT